MNNKMKRCPNCGNEILATANECKYCHTKIESRMERIGKKASFVGSLLSLAVAIISIIGKVKK